MWIVMAPPGTTVSVLRNSPRLKNVRDRFALAATSLPRQARALAQEADGITCIDRGLARG